MKYAYLIAGLIAFVLSFIVHKYFMQFMVIGTFLLVLYVVNKNSCDVEALKQAIEQHNELLKKDIEDLKKK